MTKFILGFVFGAVTLFYIGVRHTEKIVDWMDQLADRLERAGSKT